MNKISITTTINTEKKKEMAWDQIFGFYNCITV